MAIALTLGACSDNSRTTPTRENIMPIERAALRDARHAMSARDVRERESILIDIRAKEYALRSRGYTHSADIYINAVRAALEHLDGRTITVRGTLETIRGVEVRSRRIVKVREIVEKDA